MEADPLPFVRPENSLLLNVKKEKLTNMLVAKMQAIPSIKTLLGDLEVLKYACMIVENKISGKPYAEKINKKEIVIIAFEKIFGQINKEILASQIDFLYNNSQVEAVNMSKRILGYLKEWLLRKVVH
jgi:hypothetical protein